MFDKDGAFVVMKLEQVSDSISNVDRRNANLLLLQLLPLSFGPEALPPPGELPAQG